MPIERHLYQEMCEQKIRQIGQIIVDYLPWGLVEADLFH